MDSFEEDMEDSADEFNDKVEDVLSSFGVMDFSYENLELIYNGLKTKIDEINNKIIPPIEKEIEKINYYIDKKRVELEVAKKNSVIVNDISEDTEFIYNDTKARGIEEQIKTELNKRYAQEKSKFKYLDELDELTSRLEVCENLIRSYNLKSYINEIIDYFNEVNGDLIFDIDSFESITYIDIEVTEVWENYWSIVIDVIGKCNSYLKTIDELMDYFNEIKDNLEEKDPESKFVFNEIEELPNFSPSVSEIIENMDDKLISSISALYELSASYEVGEDYLNENKVSSVAKINKFKNCLLSIRSNIDNYKLEYKELKKTLNNIFVLLNKNIQSIENTQKAYKQQQDTRIRKVKEIINLINKMSFEALRQNSNEINNMINSLNNYNPAYNLLEVLQFYFSLKAKYPVNESNKEDLIDGLNTELERLTLMEIDIISKILSIEYNQKKGFIYNSKDKNIQKTNPTTVNKVSEEIKTSDKSPLDLLRGKSGNLEFTANMFLKEAQKSKGVFAVKSYSKAVSAFLDCYEVEDNSEKKLNFLKLAFKSAKLALEEKEESETLYNYSITYKKLAYALSPKVQIQNLIKMGDNFLKAGKSFLREENISKCKDSFKEAYDAYIQVQNEPSIKEKIESISKFIK